MQYEIAFKQLSVSYQWHHHKKHVHVPEEWLRVKQFWKPNIFGSNLNLTAQIRNARRLKRSCLLWVRETNNNCKALNTEIGQDFLFLQPIIAMTISFKISQEFLLPWQYKSMFGWDNLLSGVLHLVLQQRKRSQDIPQPNYTSKSNLVTGIGFFSVMIMNYA